MPSIDGSSTYQGDGTSGFYLFGFQTNTNSLKTYQKTTGTALTGDVNVVNWYDQAGGEDFVNSTAGEQPRIVMGSELVTDSGDKASVYFDGGDTLDNNNLAGQNRLDVYTILESSDNNYALLSDVTNNSRFGFSVFDGSSTANTSLNYGTPTFYANGALQSFSNRNESHDALTGSTKLLSQNNANTSAWASLTLGHYYNGTSSSDYNFTGKISEMVFFPNMNSSQKRFEIESNMMSAFELNLVTNGTFDTDSDWSKGTGWSIANGVAASDGSQSSNSGLIQYNVHTSGKTYTLTFDVVSTNSEQIKFWVNGAQNIFTSALGVGTHTYTYTALHTGTAYFEATAAFVGSIDNVKIQEVGTDGYVTTLYDQTGNNCHALQATAAYQPQLVSGGDLIKSGNHPAWLYNVGNPQKNLIFQGLEGIAHIDAFFVQDVSADTQFMVPSSSGTSYYGFAAHDGSSATTKTLNYAGNLEVNGVYQSLTDRDDVHDAIVGRKLVYHRDAVTTSWPNVQIGWFGTTDNTGWNIEGLKFSEIIWYDSDVHSNQSGIESNINTHYNIY